MMNYPFAYAPGYNPYMVNALQPQPQPQSQPNIIFMPSEEDAINYPVAPGNNLIIFIEGTKIVYEKTGASQFDKPIVKRYALEERPLETQNPTTPQYVPWSDFEALKNQLNELRLMMEEGGETA